MDGLQVEQLEVVYHKTVTAISGVSLEVPAGKIVALVGVNGAGKSTLLRAIAGLLPGDPQEITDGRITFRGERIGRLPPDQVVRRGIVLVPERDKVFESLTVWENLRTAVPRVPGETGYFEEVSRLFPVLAERRWQLAGLLSGGERQMLALARALLCQPRLLLVDEMTLGLAPKLIGQLLGSVAEMRERLEISVLLVEQNVAAALEVAEYGYVMERGRIVFHGTSERLRSHADVQEFYLGLGTGGLKSYREVKQYRRTRRWWG